MLLGRASLILKEMWAFNGDVQTRAIASKFHGFAGFLGLKMAFRSVFLHGSINLHFLDTSPDLFSLGGSSSGAKIG
jgi:hypothetical protein